MRQFHIEGFVNQYKIESISPDGKSIIFISESIENIPAGFRARETYQMINENEFTETFELAEPGKDFELYSKATLKRLKWDFSEVNLSGDQSQRVTFVQDVNPEKD